MRQLQPPETWVQCFSKVTVVKNHQKEAVQTQAPRSHPQRWSAAHEPAFLTSSSQGDAEVAALRTHSLVQSTAPQTVMCIWNTWESCQHADSDSEGLGWGLGLCISSTPPGPQTTHWVPTFWNSQLHLFHRWGHYTWTKVLTCLRSLGGYTQRWGEMQYSPSPEWPPFPRSHLHAFPTNLPDNSKWCRPFRKWCGNGLNHVQSSTLLGNKPLSQVA